MVQTGQIVQIAPTQLRWEIKHINFFFEIEPTFQSREYLDGIWGYFANKYKRR